MHIKTRINGGIIYKKIKIASLMLSSSLAICSFSQITMASDKINSSPAVITPQWVSANPPQPGNTGPVMCTADYGTTVNIRSDAGTSYPIIGQLPSGSGTYQCLQVKMDLLRLYIMVERLAGFHFSITLI